MRDTIGGTWLLQLMIVFILLFVGFIILTLNYSKTVKLKNEVITLVEKNEGLNDRSIEYVSNYLMSFGYTAKGVCTDVDKPGVYGAYDLTSSTLEPARPNTKYYYCVKKYDGANITNYYQVAIFYKFNLPVLGETSSFAVRGTTSNFHSFDSDLYNQEIGY